MKKVLVIGLLICLLTGMTGCDKEEVVRIEDYDWNLTFVLSSEDGRVWGCAPEHYEAHKDDETIQVMNIDCIVSDGKYTIIDGTNDKEYSGTYEVLEEDKESGIYTLTGEDAAGMAVTSITKGDDGSKTPTLIVSMDGYDINFQSENIE